MSDVASVLPPNSRAFEIAAGAAMSDDLPVPIRAILDPYETPAEWLPFLAAHHNVNLWYDDWSEARKREIIAHFTGRSETYPGEVLPDMIGTLAGLRRYLAYVDADIIDRIAHPRPFTFGRAVFGRTPINHRPFVAHYLVHVLLAPPPNAFRFGRAVIGSSALTRTNLEPLHRAKAAMVAAKGPATAYSVSFAWRRLITVDDAIPIDGTYYVGDWVDRKLFHEAVVPDDPAPVTPPDGYAFLSTKTITFETKQLSTKGPDGRYRRIVIKQKP